MKAKSVAALCQACRDTRLDEYDETHRCYACGALYGATKPYLWKVGRARENWIPIWLVQRCCGAQAHTEEVAIVCTYLHDGAKNAAVICELMNAKLIAEYEAGVKERE